jgi:hypothetical protein
VRDDTNGDLTKSPNQNITKSLNDAANVSFIARFRVASWHFNSATLLIQNERTMKTTSHIRMFIVVTMMTAAACSDPEIVPGTGPHTLLGNNSNREFHTTVTTWSRPDGSNYVGLVQSVPAFDLSKARITALGNGKTIKVDTILDETKLTNTGSNEDYFWASVQNNILLLHYVGATPTSLPPFPLDVIIVY